VEADSEDLSFIWDYRCRALGLCNSIGTGGLYWYGLLVKADINDAIFVRLLKKQSSSKQELTKTRLFLIGSPAA
jgi:hypothetical protein